VHVELLSSFPSPNARACSSIAAVGDGNVTTPAATVRRKPMGDVRPNGREARLWGTPEDDAGFMSCRTDGLAYRASGKTTESLGGNSKTRTIWRIPVGIPRINSTMLREHSTFFGFASALVCAIVAGSVSHWSPIWMAATAIAGIFFFPRCFYGFKEARALRDADFELGSGKSVSWYVEPPPNQLKAKAHAEMRREEAGDEPDDTEWRRLAGENDTRRGDTC